MASLQDKIDAVKAAASSTSTCTPTTVVTLKELLLPETDEPIKPRATGQQSRKTATARKPTSSSSRATTAKSASDERDESLTARDRTALATHIVNVTLKSLTEAAKPPPPSTPSKRSDDSRPNPGQRTLRRSISTPLSPLHTRTLNRVATSPNLSAKLKQSASNTQSTGCAATVECARIAFAALRALKTPQQGQQTDLQLEAGMSALIGKLLSLNMHDQALKELRLLKKRLDPSAAAADVAQVAKTTTKQSDAPIAGFGELLDFSGAISAPMLSSVVAYQLQVLKLVAATKKPAHIVSILPFIDGAYASSPINLLSRAAKSHDKEAAKAARQIASLSQLLFSMAPSVSSKDDTVAMEPRLSPPPIAAFEIQTMAFNAQITWWKLAAHKGNADEEVLAPFLRCVRALIRREKSEKDSIYGKIAAAFDGIIRSIRAQKHETSLSASSPSAALYQLLGSTAQEARHYDDAYRWFSSLKEVLQPAEDPSTRIFSVSARLLAVSLKRKALDDAVEKLAEEVLESLDGSLSGTVVDLNELLESLSLARRSVVGFMMSSLELSPETLPPQPLMESLRAFVLRYPRFLRRWLGMPPGKDASTKQVLQFDQRRQLLLQTLNQVLDATLMVIKGDIQQDKMDWQQMDDVIQDCFTILGHVSDLTMPPAKLEQFSSYRVKMSTLCYGKFSQLRRIQDRTKVLNKHMLQALSRSIELVKDCSLRDKEKSQISMKLEVFADLCRNAGRTEEAVQTLRSICRSMAEEGALTNVATLLASKPPVQAWSLDGAASTLSRTLRSIAKLDKSWNDWTFFLPEAERAAVLEHLVDINASKTNQFEPNRLRDPCCVALLRLYAAERYPIRRLRVLLHLYSQNIGNREELEDLAPEIDNAAEHAQLKDKGEDDALARFLPHLLTYYSSLSGLASAGEESATLAIRDAVSCWKSMLENRQAKDDIYSIIDNPEALLEHLQSASSFAELRGENQLQVSILELSIAVTEVQSQSRGDGIVLTNCLLATTYTSIGQFPQAMKTLHAASDLVSQGKDVSKGALADYYLSQAEYYASIGQTVKAMDWLCKTSEIYRLPSSSWARSKHQATVALSLTALLQSTVALQGGDLEGALSFIKCSVRQLSHDWSKLESTSFNSSISSESSISDDSISSLDAKPSKAQPVGPRLWLLASPLIRSLLQISTVYGHIGMFQETSYYAESAWKIAEACQSPFYMAQISAWIGSLCFKAGQIDKALHAFSDAEDQMPQEACSSRVRLARQLGEFYQVHNETAKANKYFTIAEETTRLLSGQPQAAKPLSEGKEPSKPTRGRRVAASKAVPTTRATRGKAAAAGKAQSRTVVKVAEPRTSVPTDSHQALLLAEIILSRTVGFIQQKDWQSALSTLEQAKDLPKLSESLSQEQILTAMSLIGHSMDQMIHDPVFSVMQDSTISFPAVSGCAEKNASDKSVVALSPARGRLVARERGAPTFKDSLKQAQELLLEAHTSALSSLDSSMVHRISVLLQSTVILLSATASTKSNSAAHSSLATVAVDLARNVSWRREQMTIQAQPAVMTAQTQPSSAFQKSNRRCSFGVTTEIAKFQRRYVEMLPEDWNVISISLSENQHELCITKYHAGHNPFILRLPLGRAGCRDADSETLDFEHGREELLDIIKLANETSHSARDFTAKGERSAWWSEREALDVRLRDLLVNIENAWLCGFKGIFSQHQRRSSLLARFQRDLQQVLDNNLPSRRKVRGKRATKSPSITLDPRILDLFIGLGDPSAPDSDFDEALNDLLYFVVDVLQFHGERNAYDEIDFDAMVVETYDALRAYYEAANSDGDGNIGSTAQTILVLDKLLHVFPWESMPCMEGLAVSRVPSLACLRQLLAGARGPSKSTAEDKNDSPKRPSGHYVSSSGGTYILNPSSDLKNTQTYFKPSFRSLRSWTGIVDRAPEEAEFEQALSSSSILLYFGHGSGAQYIRGKTIRRLEKCLPTTFLMGCSSAALTEAGEFECYGPVWNYMMAGCPAVVGTLWDVTDRDIDRFAGRAFEEWGLFPRGTFKNEKRGRGKTKATVDYEEDEEEDNDGEADGSGCERSLSGAVARARNVCRFKYLNAAAVVVYGIPAYIKTDG